MAQMGTGRVSGTVKDQAGNPIAGATVTAQTGDSGRVLEATSDDQRGRWAILGFPVSRDLRLRGAGDRLHALQLPGADEAGREEPGHGPRSWSSAQMGQSAGTGGGLLAEAQELHQAGRFDEALTKYDEVLMADPTVYQVNLNRGSGAARAWAAPEEAKAAYQIGARPWRPGPCRGAGGARRDLAMAENDMDEALEVLRTWPSKSTEDEVIPFNVAQIYFNNGETPKRAIPFYEIASERRAGLGRAAPAASGSPT